MKLPKGSNPHRFCDNHPEGLVLFFNEMRCFLCGRFSKNRHTFGGVRGKGPFLGSGTFTRTFTEDEGDIPRWI